MLYYVDRDLEDADRGKTDLTLLTVEYTGEHSAIATKGALRGQGYLRVRSPLLSGQKYPVLQPEEGLPFLESHGDINVDYRPETVAETWLKQCNEIPSSVFGRDADRRVQDIVFAEDALDIEWRGAHNEGGNRQELYAVLGEEPSENEQEEDVHPARVDELLDYSRRELQAVARQFGMDDVEHAGKLALARELAEHNRSRVLSELESETDAETTDTEGVA